MDSERGTGRTTKQLLASPQKFFFVVHSWGMMNIARGLQRKHCPEKDVTIVLLERIHTLMGVSDPVVIDHWAVDLIPDRDKPWVFQLMDRNNP